MKWLALGVVVTILAVALIAGLVFSSNPAPQGSTLNVGPTFSYVVSNGTYTFSAIDGFSNYSWNFGDGSTGAGSIVSHTYDLNGNYTVTLTASPAGSSSGKLSTVQQIFVSTVTSIVHNYFVNLNVSVGNSAN